MSFLKGFESKKDGIEDTVEWILRVTVVTLAAIMMAVIATLMFGLFNNDVDNAEIFSIIGPAFNTIVGAFVGLLGADDDDMEPWEKYRNDLRYDANGDGVVDADDFPDWRNPAA